MSIASRVLIAVAVAYPVASFALLKMTCGVTGIPTMDHLLMFGFVLPLFAVSAALGHKSGGSQMPWYGVVAFAVWIIAVGAAHAWFINQIWAVI